MDIVVIKHVTGMAVDKGGGEGIRTQIVADDAGCALRA